MGKRDKRQLREKLRQIRDAIPEAVRRAKSESIAELLTAEDWYAQTQELLVYAAIRSEADLSAFFLRAGQDGKILYFPRVQGEDMDFYRVDREEQLAVGAFGVMEPVLPAMLPESSLADRVLAGPVWTGRGAGRTVPILVPGLAFSQSGARMGYGKGYYDRFLAAHEELLPIGVCFEEQITEAVPMEAHDRRMACIVTERGVIRCAQER